MSAAARAGRGAVLGRVTRAGVPAVAAIEVHRLGGPEIADRARPARPRSPGEVYGCVDGKSWTAEGQASVGGSLDLVLAERVR